MPSESENPQRQTEPLGYFPEPDNIQLKFPRSQMTYGKGEKPWGSLHVGNLVDPAHYVLHQHKAKSTKGSIYP